MNGKYLDHGKTLSRHVSVASVRHIGKKAHDWAAQAHLGIDSDAQLDHGMAEIEIAALADNLATFVMQVGYAKAANTLQLSAKSIRKLCAGKIKVNALPHLPDIQAKLEIAAALETETSEAKRAALGDFQASIERDGLRKTTRQLGVDPSNLRRKIRLR